ncbi:MAG: tetratricopeptide repeat protein [Chloroflexi bacterium]|nr:tetratricopeptide repeat protein [Chloroflexota bacterium]
MTVISIREQPGLAGGHNAILCFDNEGEFLVSVNDPFSVKQERLLEWYFEEHLHFPFTRQVDFKTVAESIATYGEALFKQVFADPEAYARYKQALQAGLSSASVEISGSPELHRLHWEALKDPKMPRPIALDAAVLRKSTVVQTAPARMRPFPTINVLLVAARPYGRKDMGYRTISRPLIEGLRQANLRVRVDLVRPGTFEALTRHLDEARDRHGEGFYHVVHFDVHGALLSYEDFAKGGEANHYQCEGRFGRGEIAEYEGLRAYLALEGEEEGKPDLVQAQELANLLIAHQVPMVVLNACQSGKQVGAEETSLGSRLMQAGVQMVLAMGYSVTVSAAELMMPVIYEQLFAGKDLAAATRRAREELYNSKGRRAGFEQVIELEDWLLPVVYQNKSLPLKMREFETEREQAEFFERQAKRYRAQIPAYGFVGRDPDILRIERRVLMSGNILLVRGMGGSGKTTLLEQLAVWWQTTNLVDEVFFFSFEMRAWTLEQIVDDIARQIFGRVEHAKFQSMPHRAQQEMLAERLRAIRHLLVLDNLESVQGARLAIQHTLPPEQQEALRRFLVDLAGGRTIVLLGSRGGEDWLARGTFGDNVYELGGLDPEAASTLAERVLRRYGATKCRSEKHFDRLLKLLDGYPLALEVVLANLARKTPSEVLQALQAGDVDLDQAGAEKRERDKTESILRCVEYSHSNLSPEAQALLLCLAPFTSVIYRPGIAQYTKKLRGQPALAHLAFERFEEVLQEAVSWGLLSPRAEIPAIARIQPILPYFLRNRLQSPAQAEIAAAVDVAFREHYDDLARELRQLLRSKDAGEKQLGLAMARFEYENLFVALSLALDARVSILNPYRALFFYLDAVQDRQRGQELGELVLKRLESYPSDYLTGDEADEILSVITDIGNWQLLLKKDAEAKASYERALALLLANRTLEEKSIKSSSATIYHQLGRVAQEQRQWTQAEAYYRKALEICVEFGDRYEQAKTYHELGRVAQEQRQWAQAEAYCQKALEIYVEFDDRYSQAKTYGQLGIVAEKQRQWTQAEAYYKKALEIFVEFGDRYSQAATYHNLGTVAQEQRQWTQAEAYYRKALEIEIEFEDRYSQASTYHQLGRVAEKQRRWTQAEAYYQKALEIFVEFEDRYLQAVTYHQLGIVAEAQGQWTRAREHFLVALDIFVGQDDSHNASIVLSSLARLGRASGEDEVAKAVASVPDASRAKVIELLQKLAEGQ